MKAGWIPKRPHPETGESGPGFKQLKFLLLPELEAFYGGAAGGGKSDALLMGAVMFVHIPDYHAIIFRKTIRSLQREGGLIPRSKEWWMGRAKWTGDTLTWTFPDVNPPSTVGFGYLNNEDDYVQYGSTEYQYIGFDEVPEIRPFDYRFMFSRLRRTEVQKVANIPLRVRSAGNPIGRHVVEYKTYFNLPLGTVQKPFIPATLDDNIHLDRPNYIKSLEYLDPVTKARLLKGDWSIQDIGLMFRRSWFQLVTELPAQLTGVRYWDLAATERGAYTAGVLIGTKGDGIFYIVDIRRAQLRPREVEDLVLQTAQIDHQRRHFTQIEIWMEQEPGSSGVAEIDHYTRRVLPGFIFRGDKVTGPKELRAAPLSSAAEAGNVKILMGPWVNAFLDEIEAFPEGEYKDQVDAASGAFGKLVGELLGGETTFAFGGGPIRR